MPNADFTPSFNPSDIDTNYGSTGGDITVPTFHQLKPFRFWCQKALPLVYDDSLSYYELLCKVVDYLNNMMTDLTTATGSISEFAQQFVTNQQFLNDMAEALGDNTEALQTYINERMEDFTTAYEELQDYVNDYFTNLDVQNEINTKLNVMAQDGTLSMLLEPFTEDWLEEKTAQIDNDLANQNQTLATQNQTLATQNSRLSVLEGRMDTFASLPSGSTSGNAELVDIRTNFLGETFGQAGESVRASDLLSSGFISLPLATPTWQGQGDPYYTFNVERYKGGHIALIANMGIRGYTPSSSGQSLMFGSDEIPTKYTDMSPIHTSDLINAKEIVTIDYTDNTEYTDPVRVLSTFELPSDFPYNYISIEPAVGTEISDSISPDIIVYGNNWDKTPVDPTLTQTGEAADAKVTGDAISSLNGRLDNYLNLFISEETKTTEYNTEAQVGTTISATNRWFLNGYSYEKINSVAVRCKATDRAIKIEGWELSNNTLTKVFEKNVTSYQAYAYNVFTIDYNSPNKNPIMVSVIAPADTVNNITNTESGFNAYYIPDLTSETIAFSNLRIFTGLNVSGYVSYTTYSLVNKTHTITVSKDNSSDFQSIADAVSSATDGDVIIVYPGTYTEPIEAWGKTVDIIGIDKNTCIILNDTGNYSTPAVEIDSGRIAGFTIMSTAEHPTCDASDVSNYMRDYSIHADNVHSEGRTLIIEDCIIKNNHRTCLGIGLYNNATIIVRNCDLWSATPPNDISQPLWNKRGVIYFHNRQPSAYFNNVTGQLLKFIGNTMYCEDIIAVYIGDTCDGIDMESQGWINEMEVEFINNMICAKYANGDYKTTSDGVSKPTAFTNDSVVSGTGFTEYLKLSTISYGNNIDYLNHRP